MTAVFAHVHRRATRGGGLDRSDAHTTSAQSVGEMSGPMAQIANAFGPGRPASAALSISHWKQQKPLVHTLYVSACTDRTLTCPACDRVPLEFRGDRWACTACRGVFVEAAALVAIITAMTHALWEPPPPSMTPGARACPLCAASMAVFVSEGVTLDRCTAHGFWFDDAELGTVLHAAVTPAPTGIGGWLRRVFG